MGGARKPLPGFSYKAGWRAFPGGPGQRVLCARPWCIISRNQIRNGWPGLIHKKLFLSQALSKPEGGAGRAQNFYHRGSHPEPRMRASNSSCGASRYRKEEAPRRQPYAEPHSSTAPLKPECWSAAILEPWWEGHREARVALVMLPAPRCHTGPMAWAGSDQGG